MSKLRQNERLSDMGQGVKLSLLLDDDGKIMPVCHRLADQSPKTVTALHDLFKAMEGRG